MEIIIKCADTSNVLKPFNVAKKWAMRVTDEFFLQVCIYCFAVCIGSLTLDDNPLHICPRSLCDGGGLVAAVLSLRSALAHRKLNCVVVTG
mmetsp:Transcript_55761/g.147303  ORF Transcript_55761/g.147303 Transcript_55761/m.147303 type:complete len:91 (-) Transcript_55761:661-933(-)